MSDVWRDRIQVHGPMHPGYSEILTPEALAFVGALVETVRDGRKAALTARLDAQKAYDAGQGPDFLPETENIRSSDWTVAPLPADLQDRRVEITGPVDRKMIINALNSGATCFMADFEDSNAPTWSNCIEGQINLRDAIAGTISFIDEKRGKTYALNDKVATLHVRPRGWHLVERHVTLDGEPMPGGVFDFGLYFFHNVRPLLAKNSGPYFYLPKMQSHREARLWNQVFVKAQSLLDIPLGTIKATVLIETLPAAFELHEILYELKEHSAGLNCGRWDYIFSYVKTLQGHADKLLPDRGQVGMTQPFMRAYSQLVIKTCHRRGVHAMGGMAAQIPIKNDPAANEAALAKVKADKEREVADGHDGTWVAHPGLVPIAKAVFDAGMPGPNQIANKREDYHCTREDLVAVPEGTRSEAGLRHNINVGLLYIESWLRGLGCVPIYNLMEDAATAEISRSQVWQWVKFGAQLDDGQTVTRDLVARLTEEELQKIRAMVGDAAFESGRFNDAKTIFSRTATGDELVAFLTLPAYEALTD